MKLKSLLPHFFVLLCCIISVFTALPDNAFGGAFATTSSKDLTQLDPDLIKFFLGETSVPSSIAQPALPMELRPSGVPKVKPGSQMKSGCFTEQPSLFGALPAVIEKKAVNLPPELLPQPEPEPGIVYVLPFTGVMVPDEVNEQVFDQFVDAMNQQSAALGLQFVILKQDLARVGSDWLASRKYITGEIYAYVEDLGVNSTEIRTKARISFYRPSREMPVFETLLPAVTFFDHDQSDITAERKKLARSIASTLTERLLASFKSSLISKYAQKAQNNGA